MSGALSTAGYPSASSLPSVAAKRWLLRDGTALTVRSLASHDRAALRAFLDSLSVESRYQRFFVGSEKISEALLEFLCAPGAPNDLRLVVLEPGRSSIIAEARLAALLRGEAEIAITVAEGWQGRGIGRMLLGHLIATARSLGLETLHADFLAENRRMRALLREAQFTLSSNPKSATVGHAQIALGDPALAARQGSSQHPANRTRPSLAPV